MYLYNVGVDIEHMPRVHTAQSIEMTIIIANAILKLFSVVKFCEFKKNSGMLAILVRHIQFLGFW